MSHAIVIAAMTILVGFAFFRKSRRFRLATVCVLIAVLLVREISITIYTWSIIKQSVLDGPVFEHFRQGALDMLNHSYATAVIAVPIWIVIILLCIRGFRNPGLKRQPDRPRTRVPGPVGSID